MPRAPPVPCPIVTSCPKTCCKVAAKLVASPLAIVNTLSFASASGIWSSSLISASMSSILLAGARTIKAFVLRSALTCTSETMPLRSRRPPAWSNIMNSSAILGSREPACVVPPPCCWPCCIACGSPAMAVCNTSAKSSAIEFLSLNTRTCAVEAGSSVSIVSTSRITSPRSRGLACTINVLVR